MKNRKQMFNGKRSQAAMEFLMTYGWAILVVLAAIVALAYFGVMSPSRFFPEACTLPATGGMACLDFKVTSDSAYLLIINSGGRDYTINNISVGDCVTAFGSDLPDSHSVLFNVTGCSFGAPGKRIKEDLDVSYSQKDSTFTKTAQGSLAAMIH
ncbi:hypothetical protein KY359_05330 [Candidatus Woesearchaeota archaeon]|nr:hypothetical protein [Candidatus Woesearchaeota archaeon]